MTEIGLPRTTAPFASVTSTDFTYTGQRDITGTGLMDYNARFYSPTLGRFTQPDTIIPNATDSQSWNRYSYVSNNPINFNDPSGHKQVKDEFGGNGHGSGGGGGGDYCTTHPWTCGGGGGGDPDDELKTENDDVPLGHEYWAANPICQDYFWINCTDDEIYDYMTHWQYPGQLFWDPVQNNKTYNVFPDQFAGFELIGRWYPGSGKIYVSIDGNTISNIGYPSHIFDGRVDRYPVRDSNGTPYVISHGTGTNTGFHLTSFQVKDWTVTVGLPGPLLDSVNQKIGPPAFNLMDKGLLLYTTIVETGQALSCFCVK